MGSNFKLLEIGGLHNGHRIPLNVVHEASNPMFLRGVAVYVEWTLRILVDQDGWFAEVVLNRPKGLEMAF